MRIKFTGEREKVLIKTYTYKFLILMPENIPISAYFLPEYIETAKVKHENLEKENKLNFPSPLQLCVSYHDPKLEVPENYRIYY